MNSEFGTKTFRAFWNLGCGLETAVLSRLFRRKCAARLACVEYNMAKHGRCRSSGCRFSMKQLNDSLCDSPSPRAVGPSVSHSGRVQSYRWSGIRNSRQNLRACPVAKSLLAAPAKSENASPLVPVLVMGVVLVRQSEATALPKVRNDSRAALESFFLDKRFIR